MDDIAYIALGSNIGDRLQHLADARTRIASIDGVTVLAESSIEETEPLGPVQQNPFLNQMIALRTSLNPSELLAALQTIELAGGRVRTERWGPRTIDLDIVKYQHTTWSSADLAVPHVEIANRPFWRRELEELTECMP